MRITMLSKAVVVGAYQRKLEKLARLPDVDLTVIVPPRWRDSRGEAPLERAYVQGYRLVESPIVLNGHYHAHFYPRLGRELDRSQPDLVHVDEEPYNLAAWQATRWAAHHRRPAIFFTWQNLGRRYPPPFNWIERYNYRLAAHAIAGNQEARQVLRTKGYAGPISVIPQFGVDPDLYRPEPGAHAVGNSRGTALVAGYAGGLVPEKGVDVLLHAVAICRRRALPCRAVIAGAGPEQPKLEALAKQLAIGDAVTFVGRLASTDMPSFYAGIDVLVLPSRTTSNWKEQFGRVLIEAMACERAVLGSDSGEIPHVIGEAGWVFSESDAEGLAAQLQRLAADPDLRAGLGRQGRQRVLQHYTQQRVAAATYEVYRQVLTGWAE